MAGKGNKTYMLCSLANMFTAICFAVAAVFSKNAIPKVLFLIGAACLFISSIGFLTVYFKK